MAGETAAKLAADGARAGHAPWRIAATVLIVLVAIAFFFRSVLPRVPRLFLRGRLRINRIGVRGIRGIEWRSKGFSSGSKDAALCDDQLHIKVQRVHAVLRRPRWTRPETECGDGSAIRSRSLLTIHVRGVGVKLPRSRHDKASSEETLSKARDRQQALQAEDDRRRQEHEERLQSLLDSAEGIPAAKASNQTIPASDLPRRSGQSLEGGSGTAASMPQGSSMHRAGLLSLQTFLHLATWIRISAVPAVRRFALRFMRASLFIITSSLPSLTSLVDIQVHRIEVYVQEAEAVTRIGRAGIEVSMALVSPRDQARKGHGDADLSRVAPFSDAKPPTWLDVFEAAARMPNRIGSGARGAASYLMAGLPDGKACLRLRVEGVQVFEADLNAGREQRTSSAGRSSSAPRKSQLAEIRSTDLSRPDSPLAKHSHRHAASHSRSESLTNIDSTPDRAQTGEAIYEWPGVSSPRSLSPVPLLKRSNSASMLGAMSSMTLSGFTDRWADWALEPLADSDFSAETGWMPTSQEKSTTQADQPRRPVTVPEPSRLMSLPGVSELQIGILLGTNFTFKAKEMIDIAFTMCETSLGMDAMMRVASILESRKARRAGWSPTVEGLEKQQRSVASKHLAKQEKAIFETALRTLSTLTFSVPLVRMMASPKSELPATVQSAAQPRLPERLVFEAALTGFHVELGTSNPSSDLHQRWLGACGVKDHLTLRGKYARKQTGKAPQGRSSTNHSAGEARTEDAHASQFKRRTLVEHRRAFAIDLGLASFELHCGLKKEPLAKRSELLSVGDLAVKILSTWTPFGIFTSCSDSGQGPSMHFAGDFNEETAVLSAAIGRISGDVQMEHLSEILRLRSFFHAKRVTARSKHSIEHHHRSPTQINRLYRVPRLIAGVEVSSVEYSIDVSSPTLASAHRERKLAFLVPHLNLNFAGDYHDEYVKRPSAAKRASYKRLQQDALEWPLTGSAHLRTVPEVATPSMPSNDQETLDVAEDAEDAEAFPQQLEEPQLARFRPNDGTTASVSLTMEEALKQMLKLQSGETSLPRQASTARGSAVRENTPRPTSARTPGYSRRSSLAAETLYSHRYQFEVGLQIEAVEAYLSLSGNHASSRRGFLRPTSSLEAPKVGSSQHHLLALHTFELGATGGVPGNVERFGLLDEAEVPWVSVPDAEADLRASVEDVDVELWHPAALQSYLYLADCLAEANQSLDPWLFEEGPKSGTEPSPDQPAAAQNTKDTPGDGKGSDALDTATPMLLDRLPGGLTVYVSIGSAIAHLGGQDPKCDHHISRGIGLESKRIVLDFSAVTETKNNVSHQKGGWGARGALQLPQDLRLQAASLSSRHGRVALARVTFFETGLFPILDAAQATKQHMEGKAEEGRSFDGRDRMDAGRGPTHAAKTKASAVFADAVWDFDAADGSNHEMGRKRPKFRQQDRSNFIFWMPLSSFKAIIRPRSSEATDSHRSVAEEVVITAEDNRLLAFKIDLLHTYCVLLTVSMLKGLVSRRSSAPPPEAPAKDSKASPSASTIKPTLGVHIDLNEVHISITLPQEVHLFLRVRRLEVKKTIAEGLSVAFESIMAAVESPKLTNSDLWEEAVRLRDFKVILPNVSAGAKRRVEVSGDTAMIHIPFGYVVNRIIDNSSVAFKATKQLLHQFLTGRSDSKIVPVGEEPKRLPDISFHLRILVIEAQDDPFETRLNIIWRAGCDENRAREEREAAFQAKVAEILEQERVLSVTSFRTGSVESFADTASYDTQDADSDSSSLHGNATARMTAEGIQEARISLDAYSSSSWIRRHRNARAEQARRQEAALRRLSGRLPMRVEGDLPIRIAPLPRSVPLVRSTMTDLTLDLGEPARFAGSKLRDFIHEQGGGIPRDTVFSLLIPIHLRWQMKEWRVSLRDYPMPLLHIPPPSENQPSSLKSWDLNVDFVVAEQLGGPESIRHVPAVVVPAATGRPDAVEYGILVPKVAMPVKLYGSPKVSIQTSYATRLVWGQSIQPAIHDVVRVFDGITSPPHDPSPKLGFWDKIPLIMHGKLLIEFTGEGDLNLHLKGSRDPYQIVGQAAGWVKCWRGGVQLRINYPNDDNEFFQILSHSYMLAIPDLRDYTDTAAMGLARDRPHPHKDRHQANGDRKSINPSLGSSSRRFMHDPTFSKVVLKLTNGVKWGAGLLRERTCNNETCQQTPKCQGEAFYRECRFFDRIPHWEVVTKTKAHFESLPESERVDSYRGWRSDHIHLSISVFSPEQGLPGFGDAHRSNDVSNNFYFTPLAWAHFWAWMRLFNSAMGLPIRHGSLFPESTPPSPKMGRHLGTIKYRIDLAPLFITHQYLQMNKSDWARGLKTFLGVKARLGLFRLDLHQRQQETIKEKPELGAPRIVFHKPFYEAQVDCSDIDLRTLCAQFNEPSLRLLPSDEADADTTTLEDLFSGDHTISDSDLQWVDLDDFVELDDEPARDPKPEIRLYPALACPAFNYYRKIDSQRERKAKGSQRTTRSEDRTDRTSMGSSDDSSEGIENDTAEALVAMLERSKFGREASHTCLVGTARNPMEIQAGLAEQRLKAISSEMEKLKDASQQAGGPGSTTSSNASSLPEEDQAARLHDLEVKANLVRSFIQYLGKIQDKLAHHEVGAIPSFADTGFEFDFTDLTSLYNDLDNFDNRYFAHNPTLFFSNATRSVLLKYYYSSRLRRGYCHHMSATAVRYIRELAKAGLERGSDRQSEADGASQTGQDGDSHRRQGISSSDHQGSHQRRDPSKPGRGRRDSSDSYKGSEPDIASALHGMLEDVLRHTEPHAEDSHQTELGVKSPSDGISSEFRIKSSNVCLFIQPQIVLRSDVDSRSTVVITALRARLHNYTVMDEKCAEDSVNAIVLRRNFFSLDGMQCFHPSKRCSYRKHADERFGCVFVPLETLLDLQYHTRDFDRIVPRTNAHLFYDKFNKLRMSDSSRTVAALDENGDPKHDHLYHRMDVIRLSCPKFTVSANSDHFAAMYNVVTDLILYRDPAYKDHAKQLEEAMFSHDYSDVSGLTEVVTVLQDRIRDTYELAHQYRHNLDRLTEQGRVDLYALGGELLDLVEELNIIMEAITAAQDSKNGADREKKSALRFDTMAKDLSWNMMGDEDGQLLAKLALKGIKFAWLNKADNSAANTLSLQDLQALNVRPDAMFAEIISKYHKAPDHPMAKKGRFLDVMWSVLPPVGGISIIDSFESHQHPVRIQVELLVGRQIMDYVFGSQRQRKKQENRQKEIERKVRKKEEQDEAKSKSKKNPLARLLLGHKRSEQKQDIGSGPRSVPSSRSTSASEVSLANRASIDGVDDDDDFDARTQGSTGHRSAKSQRSTGKDKDSSRPRSATSGAKTPQSSDEDEVGQYAIARKNAVEMRNRAAAYRSFVDVTFSETIFCLSYKGEKQKSITDLYDVVFQTPRFGVRNRTFGYVDLAYAFKKDVIRAAWAQKATLLKGVLTHRPQRRKAAIEHIKAIRHGRPKDSPSAFDIEIQPPTPSTSSSTSSPSFLSLNADAASYDSDEGASQHSAPVSIITTPADDDNSDDDDEGQHAREGGSTDGDHPRHRGSAEPSMPSVSRPAPVGGSQPSNAGSSPSFKLGKFLSRNFRHRSGSASGSVSSLTVSMSRNSSTNTNGDGTTSPSSSNGSQQNHAHREPHRSPIRSASPEGAGLLALPASDAYRYTLGDGRGSNSGGRSRSFRSSMFESSSAAEGISRARSSDGATLSPVASGTVSGSSTPGKQTSLFPRRGSLQTEGTPARSGGLHSAERSDSTVRDRRRSLFETKFRSAD